MSYPDASWDVLEDIVCRSMGGSILLDEEKALAADLKADDPERFRRLLEKLGARKVDKS